MRAKSRVKNDNSQLDLFAERLPRFDSNTPAGSDATAPADGSDALQVARNVPGLELRVLPARTKDPTDPLLGAPPSAVADLGTASGPAVHRLGDGTSSDKSPDDNVAIPSPPIPPTAEPNRNQRNYRIADADGLGCGSPKRKCRDNLAAIELLRALEAAGSAASEVDKAILVRYVGWGGLPQVFDDYNEGWRNERAQLNALLTSAELESARATTLNAHYTSPTVIRAMYTALQRFGFEHGRVLEPAVGLGHFIGVMPDRMHCRSQITGIEIDSVTARLAKTLYPDADIRHQPFEEAKLADDFYDVAISNIPFGDYPVFDSRFRQWRFLIHDYFFAAALTKVRPGGLVLFITSRGTMDKADSALRLLVSQQADLLGAIRLPNDAFKQNANTEVTTDIVMLRRRLAGERPTGPSWRNLVTTNTPDGETLPINEYFATRPEMMLGEMRLVGRMYARGEPTLTSNGRDLSEQLNEAIKRLPEGVFRSRPGPRPPSRLEQTFAAPEEVKPNAYALVNGQVARREGDVMRIVAGLSAVATQRIRGLIRLRDCVRRCLQVQLDDSLESEIVVAREQLNQAYDHFIGKFGFLSERANTSAFRGDPDLPLLLSLEHFDATTRSATKAAIFHERTLQPPREPERVDSPKDALVLSLSERGAVDLDYMGQLLRHPAEEFLPELAGAIFLDPQTRRWETEDAYLSGSVRAKLEAAEAAALVDPSFRGNVEALRAAQPPDLMAAEIDARLGGSWIPAEDIQHFAQELLGESGIAVSHAIPAGLWMVSAGWSAKNAVANTSEWGTDRASAVELLEDALNLRTPTIYDYDAEADRSVVNAAATEAARDKQEKLKERFKAWIWKDNERRERLVRIYNDTFNGIRLRSFSGEHLTLPGASPAIRLRPHQKAAVWRILQTPNCLLAHSVGAGIMPTAGLCRIDPSSPRSGVSARVSNAA